MANKSIEALSDITVFTKYARHLPEKERRETWEEIVDRYLGMMVEKYCSNADYRHWQKHKSVSMFMSDHHPSPLYHEILMNGQYIYEKKILMSMRAAQFAGMAIKKNESRIYNCAYLPMDDYRAFSEVMFLLLGGTGVGYSVQKHDVEKLPEIRIPYKKQKFLIGDSIEGWADSIRALFAAYYGKRSTKPVFDYSDIREKGELLITAGGKAPGPDPLRICHVKIEAILHNKNNGEKLTTVEVNDINCHIADAVLAGGIRRAAMISLFSFDDLEMATSKHGNWWELNPQRGRANNSAVIVRNRIKRKEFRKFWKLIKESNSGEPGIYFTNDPAYGTNPCCEISLRMNTFCNLNEINGGTLLENVDLQSENWTLDGMVEFKNRASSAAFFGTLQAGFTDFHYLRNIWKRNTEKDALTGIGITGICGGDLDKLMKVYPNLLKDGAELVKEVNARVAELIGINPAARTTTIKPSGNSSCFLGVSSGIHAWHSKYYIRNIQCGVGDDLYNHFTKNHPQLIKIMDHNPNSAVIGIPIKAPDSATFREDETAVQMINRVLKYNMEWVKEGHNKGVNTNNVSATVNIKDHEWDEVGEMMWKNKSKYNGLSVIPYDGGSYKDAPYIECDEQTYLEKLHYVSGIDLTKLNEVVDNTNLSGEIACSGGACEV